MSILIKGLGMPNAHQVRPFYLKGNGDGTATVCEYTTGMQTGVAIPLPEKHGRLGDLDSVKEKLLVAGVQAQVSGDPNAYLFAMGLKLAEEIVDGMDTIVPAEGGGEV